jgi:hypothetical protein
MEIERRSSETATWSLKVAQKNCSGQGEAPVIIRVQLDGQHLLVRILYMDPITMYQEVSTCFFTWRCCAGISGFRRDHSEKFWIPFCAQYFSLNPSY